MLQERIVHRFFTIKSTAAAVPTCLMSTIQILILHVTYIIVSLDTLTFYCIIKSLSSSGTAIIMLIEKLYQETLCLYLQFSVLSVTLLTSDLYSDLHSCTHVRPPFDPPICLSQYSQVYELFGLLRYRFSILLYYFYISDIKLVTTSAFIRKN